MRSPVKDSLRWRLVTWFVSLSSLVYLTLTALGMVLFYFSLTHLLDVELHTITSEISHAVEVTEDGKLQFRDWALAVQTEYAHALTSNELFDMQGNLIEYRGIQGSGRHLSDRQEVEVNDKRMRVDDTAILLHGKQIGYLQVELATTARDDALRNFGFSMAIIAPLVLLGLGISSYIVAGKAVKPLQDSVVLLRQFVADASHELNTPLAIVQAQAESYEHKMSKSGTPQEDIAVIRRHLNRMEKIVRDLTFLAEMETPLKSDNQARSLVDLAGIAHQVVSEFQERFSAKGVRLIADIQPTVTLGNSEAIYRLTMNLIENALRYTDEGGSVTVSTHADSTVVRLSVADTGIGIPSESLQRIFDRFYRVDKSRSRSSGGSGIGLSIVKAIADAHGGHVTVESKLGNGSKFIVTLPLRTTPLARNLHDNQPRFQ